jgi:peptidoglycan/LPS O-acetylase OafA/YrhL
MVVKENQIQHPSGYRPDIDGLRAIAVIGVILFHAGLGVPGGFAGVDVFFVISGFLITQLIVRDLERGTFSMVSFWERRVRRIFPALFATVLVCLVAGWFLLLPYGYLVLAQSAIALSLFASNIQFWRTTDYFSPLAEENALLHTWSLSVEEQFYLIVPLMLVGLYRFRKGRFLSFASLVTITAVSFVVSVVWLQKDPAGAFYLLPSRAWELGVGALLVFLPAPCSIIGRYVASVAGLMAVVYSFFFFVPGSPFPGVAALPAVVGTALVIWSGIPTNEGCQIWPMRLLAWRPMVSCGLMSYSLYLWHWPFFAFHRYVFDHLPTPTVSVAYVAAAFVISGLSLRFVETPFRQRRLCGSRRSIFVFFFTGTVLVTAAALVIYLGGGLSFRVPPEALRLDGVEGDRPFEAKPERMLVGGTKVYRFGDAGEQPKVLLWGDSHAGVLLSVIDEICREAGVSGRGVIRGRTPPLFDWSGERETTLEHEYSMAAGRFVQQLLQTEKVRIVFLAFRWSYYTRRDPPLDPSRVPQVGFDDALLETISKVQGFGAKVVLLKEVPVFPAHVPRAMALARWIGTSTPSLTIAAVEAFQKPYDPSFQRLQDRHPDVTIVDPVSSFAQNRGIDYIDADGVLLWRDQHHLTHRATMRLAPELREALVRALAQ